jgi:hypothetical protein
LLEGCPIVTAVVPRHVLLVCEPFSARLGAERVAAAIAAGLLQAGQAEPDTILLALPDDARLTAEMLVRERFQARMRAARAVVLAVSALHEQTLAGSAAFEVATQARQSGVPCYAIAAINELDAFDLRILDLQVVLEASGAARLRSAGARLAALLSAAALSAGSPGTSR